MAHVLKDGTEVEIRTMTADDLERSYAFFQALPEEDRQYLRVDVTIKDVVRRRVHDVKGDAIRRLVAVVGGEIVADGSLEKEGGWKAHSAELRLIVSRRCQGQGLGMLMARELYHLASSEQVEALVVKMMRPQKAARRIFEKLGFRRGAVLEDYVKDRRGQAQDLVVMHCNLSDLWAELEHHVSSTDWVRTR